MNKNKKMILIIVGVIVALALVAGIVWWLVAREKGNALNGEKSKVNALYEEFVKNPNYTFETTLNEQNKTFYARKDNMAYVDIKYQGEKSKYLVKDGNTYLIMDEQKTYYTYRNSDIDLQRVTLQLENVKNNKGTKGKEEIEGKNYNYEEFENVSDFLMRDIERKQDERVTTKFYFDNNQLAYIKTTVGEYEELLKVTVSQEVDNKLFAIPSGYTEN